MEPISTAIIAALANLAEPAIKDSYNALKNLILRKFGKGHDVVQAMETLETHPTSEGRAATLKEEVVKSNVQTDADILKVAQVLLERIQTTPGGQQIIQKVSGNRNIVAGRDANVNLGQD